VAGGVELLAVDRADVEAYARDLEQAGRARSTVARRLATLAWFYRYAVEEAALPRSPVAHVRRPSVARDSQKLGLDRDEAARFLAAAESACPLRHLWRRLVVRLRVCRRVRRQNARGRSPERSR
jgi:integrase/recombinase XerD